MPDPLAETVDPAAMAVVRDWVAAAQACELDRLLALSTDDVHRTLREMIDVDDEGMFRVLAATVLCGRYREVNLDECGWDTTPRPYGVDIESVLLVTDASTMGQAGIQLSPDQYETFRIQWVGDRWLVAGSG